MTSPPTAAASAAIPLATATVDGTQPSPPTAVPSLTAAAAVSAAINSKDQFPDQLPQKRGRGRPKNAKPLVYSLQHQTPSTSKPFVPLPDVFPRSISSASLTSNGASQSPTTAAPTYISLQATLAAMKPPSKKKPKGPTPKVDGSSSSSAMHLDSFSTLLRPCVLRLETLRSELGLVDTALGSITRENNALVKENEKNQAEIAELEKKNVEQANLLKGFKAMIDQMIPHMPDEIRHVIAADLNYLGGLVSSFDNLFSHKVSNNVQQGGGYAPPPPQPPHPYQYPQHPYHQPYQEQRQYPMYSPIQQYAPKFPPPPQHQYYHGGPPYHNYGLPRPPPQIRVQEVQEEVSVSPPPTTKSMRKRKEPDHEHEVGKDSLSLLATSAVFVKQHNASHSISTDGERASKRVSKRGKAPKLAVQIADNVSAEALTKAMHPSSISTIKIQADATSTPKRAPILMNPFSGEKAAALRAIAASHIQRNNTASFFATDVSSPETAKVAIVGSGASSSHILTEEGLVSDAETESIDNDDNLVQIMNQDSHGDAVDFSGEEVNQHEKDEILESDVGPAAALNPELSNTQENDESTGYSEMDMEDEIRYAIEEDEDADQAEDAEPESPTSANLPIAIKELSKFGIGVPVISSIELLDPFGLVNIGEKGIVQVWNLTASARRITAIDCKVDGYVRFTKTTPDKKTMIIGGEFNKLLFYDVRSEQKTVTMACQIPPFQNASISAIGAVVSPDSRTVVTTHSSGCVNLWDIRQACLVRKLGQHKDTAVNCGVWSGDGTELFVSGAVDGTVATWDPRGGNGGSYQVGLLSLDKPVYSLSCDPRRDGICSVGLSNGSLEVWNLSVSGNPWPVRRLTHAHSKAILGVKYVYDGAWVASMAGKSLKIWSTETFGDVFEV
ncbi:UNVERIFIED_CONTAM: Transducin-like enhancer protein 4 [Siphonaria sp. JEL0065]|nr:Transducin-like enhancer protein 4 [Siphonaria sp. JEL0065]